MHPAPNRTDAHARVALVAALVASTFAIAPPPARAATTVPARLTDVQGVEIDVADLAARNTLIVVTLKAPGCPVCQEQLHRLVALRERLRACGATFIVLAPGPAEALRELAERSGFPYPFIEDTNVALARSIGLALGDDEIMPAFFQLDAAREIVWMQRGRGPGAFGERELLAHLGCRSSAGDRIAAIEPGVHR